MSAVILNRRLGGAARPLAIIPAIALAVLAGCVPAEYSSADYVEPEISDYDYLARYGEWISVPHYDLVWRPYVVADWTPFYNGHWVWTDDGWAWVSYEPFGMLVYHYGFWDYSLRYGWVWIPDDVWSPARVEWYYFDDYCAWAPMPPPHMSWPAPWNDWDIGAWIVVPVDRFTSDDVGRYRVYRHTRDEIVGRGRAIKAPPDVQRVRTAAKEPLREIQMERERVPIDRDVTRTRPKPGRPGKGPLKKMVLPRAEREKIDEYSPKIEREVLKPKKEKEQKEERGRKETRGKSGDSESKDKKKKESGDTRKREKDRR
jgi:hypothetical protein